MNPETDALRALREYLRLSETQFAELLDARPEDVVAWEAGGGHDQTRWVVRCARALGMSVSDLLSRSFAHQPVPALFLRAQTHQGDVGALLGAAVGDALAAFVQSARAVGTLRAQRGAPTVMLPRPPVDAVWGTGQAPYGADALAAWLRKELAIATPAIRSMRDVCEQLGITVLWAARDEMDASIDGAALRSPAPTVLVHLVEGPSCWWRTRMTLAHEICHVLCDFGDEREDLALVSPSITDGDTEAAAGTRAAARRPWRLFKDFEWIEQRASAFASHFLVPDEELRAAVFNLDPTSEEAVAAVCQRFGVGRITAVSRLRHVFSFSEDLRKRMIRRAHVEEHSTTHNDIPPNSACLRGGPLLDEVVLALVERRIDRVEAHRLLDLLLRDSLPPHPALDIAQRAPLRSVEDDVRAVVLERLRRQRRCNWVVGRVMRRPLGWHVELKAPGDDSVSEEMAVSFDLDQERTRVTA